MPASAREALAAALGPKVALGNPLDYHTYVWGDFEPTRAVFSAMLDAGYDMNALVLDFPRADRCDGSSWKTTLAAFEAARAATAAPAAVVASLPETMPEAIAERLVGEGVVPFNGMSEALTAMRLAAEVGEAWARPASAPLHPAAADRRQAGADARRGRSQGRAGALRPRRSRVSRRPARRGGAGGGQISAFPSSSKRCQRALAHKTDVGGVRLDLRDATAVEQAASGDGAFERPRPDRTDAEGALAELIVGVTRDALFGLALTVGAGGVLADLIDDHATLLLPASRAEIEAALRSLKIARLLDGYRGGKLATGRRSLHRSNRSRATPRRIATH